MAPLLSAALGAPVPVPLSATVGVPPFEVRLSTAIRDPVLLGLNVMVIAQVAPAATLDPHVFVCAKSAAFAPAMPIAVTDSAALPVFVNIAFAAALVTLTP